MRADITISLGDEHGLSCLTVAHRSRYLGALLGLTRHERRLVKLLGVWPRWRMRRERVAALLTVLTTESNREIAMTVLEEELRRSGMSSRGV